MTHAPLRNITREILEPLWRRPEIRISTIAERLGVKRQSLSKHAHKLGLPSRKGNAVMRHGADAAEFERMWRAGVHTDEMARHFGYASRDSVSRRRIYMGLPARVRAPGNAGGWPQTITMAQYREARLGERMRRAA